MFEFSRALRGDSRLSDRDTWLSGWCSTLITRVFVEKKRVHCHKFMHISLLNYVYSVLNLAERQYELSGAHGSSRDRASSTSRNPCGKTLWYETASLNLLINSWSDIKSRASSWVYLDNLVYLFCATTRFSLCYRHKESHVLVAQVPTFLKLFPPTTNEMCWGQENSLEKSISAPLLTFSSLYPPSSLQRRTEPRRDAFFAMPQTKGKLEANP